MERVRLIVHGIVQGVFFRANTIREARLLGLTGYVRNRADGTVEAVAEGPKDSLSQFVDWCRHGPEMARVEKIDVSWESHRGEFSQFGLG